MPAFSEDQGISTPGGDPEGPGEAGSRGQDVGRVAGWTQMKELISLVTYPTLLSKQVSTLCLNNQNNLVQAYINTVGVKITLSEAGKPSLKDAMASVGLVLTSVEVSSLPM